MRGTVFSDIIIVCGGEILNEKEEFNKHKNWFALGELPSTGDLITFKNQQYRVSLKHFKVVESPSGEDYDTVLEVVVEKFCALNPSNRF